MSIKNELISWFVDRSGVDRESLDIHQNYFEAKLIDSFDVLELMEFCESKFNIELSETQFEDRRFSSINGLAQIICELLDEKKNG